MIFKNYLAPLFDYTDLPFRLLCQRYGAHSCCFPMANSMAISRDIKKITQIDTHPDESNAGVQIVGGDPDAIGKTSIAIADSLSHVKWLNLNAGCPSPRTMKCGGGSDLLRNPKKILESVKRMRAADLPTSVKIRILEHSEKTILLCKAIEGEGADMIIVHGRTEKQGYSGNSNWELIREIKENLDIPVIGNGDVQFAKEGESRIKAGYCDSYMIGRAAMSNPKVFSNMDLATLGGRFSLLEEYICLCSKYQEEMQLVPIRQKAMNFIRGSRNAARLRDEISRASTVQEILEIKRTAIQSEEND